MTHSPLLGVLHLLLLLQQVSLKFFPVTEQVLNLLLHLVLQLLHDVIDFPIVVLLLLEDIQLCIQLLVLILQVFDLE